MKSYKLIGLISVTTTVVLGIATIVAQQYRPQIIPLSNKNTFQSELNYSLNLAKLNPQKIIYREFINQIEFYLQPDYSNNPIKIILDTKQNPTKQVSSLQKIFKTAKMEGKEVGLIDLSIDHPYVTFKNN